MKSLILILFKLILKKIFTVGNFVRLAVSFYTLAVQDATALEFALFSGQVPLDVFNLDMLKANYNNFYSLNMDYCNVFVKAMKNRSSITRDEAYLLQETYNDMWNQISLHKLNPDRIFRNEQNHQNMRNFTISVLLEAKSKE